MIHPTEQNLLDARVHFGHLSCKWHPSFAPYILMKQNHIHIIDLKTTLKCLKNATKAMKELIQSGKKILFISTKKTVRTLIKNTADKLEQPYVTERWLGGTLTNFSTIRRLLKKRVAMQIAIEAPSYKHLTKREQLTIARKKKYLDKTLQGISTINRLPSAIFVVDIKKEETSIREANKLGIPIFAIVDTNSSPELVDYPIPANDDARSSISCILDYITSELEEGLSAWKAIKTQVKS